MSIDQALYRSWLLCTIVLMVASFGAPQSYPEPPPGPCAIAAVNLDPPTAFSASLGWVALFEDVRSTGLQRTWIISYCNLTTMTPRSSNNCAVVPYFAAAFLPGSSDRLDCEDSYNELVEVVGAPVAGSNFSVTYRSNVTQNKLVVEMICGALSRIVYRASAPIPDGRLIVGETLPLCPVPTNATFMPHDDKMGPPAWETPVIVIAVVVGAIALAGGVGVYCFKRGFRSGHRIVQ